MAKEARLKSQGTNDLGALPVWDLSDLYAAMDAPELKRDLQRADEESRAFEARYKGELKTLAESPDGGAKLAQAIAEFEKVEEVLGRLGSYAGLVHAGDTTDPARSKFFGDVQDKLTAISTHLLFFGLELNRLDDAVIEKALQTPALAVYRPWLEDLRLERPYQLEDRIEQLFHEKYATGRGAWNRLFDETLAIAPLRRRRREAAARADAQSPRRSRRDEAQGGGGGARRDLQGEHPLLHARHQRARQGQVDLRRMARLQGRGGGAAPFEPG